MDVKTVGPKIRTTTHDWYKDYFPTVNAGATWLLEEFPYIYKAAISELRGTLTKGELSMILDVMNGTMYTYGHGIAGQYLPISIQDSFDLYPGVYEDKWKTDKETFLRKIQQMHRFQITCLELWASGFWNQLKTNETTFEDWLSTLL